MAGRRRAAPDKQNKSFWELIDFAEYETAKAMCPEGHDWGELCPTTEITLLQAVVHALWTYTDKVPQGLRFAAWAIEQGADPKDLAPDSCEWTVNLQEDCGGWVGQDPDDAIVEFGGDSAIGALLAFRGHLQKEMEDHDDALDWGEEVKALTELLDVFRQAASTGPCRTQPIDSGVVGTWETLCNDQASHDVVFETSTGPASAHSIVLSSVSPVLAAMLTSGFAEGKQKQIDVKDVSGNGVRLLLDLVYTGGTSTTLDHAVALAALDLAHRWLMNNVVAMLERALKEMLSDKTFADITEAAKLKNLSSLLSSCTTFARSSTKVKADLAKRTLPKVVMEFLDALTPGHPVKKRRCL